MKTIDTMLRRLEANPEVTGLIRYGSDHREENYSVGDYDLFVVFSSWQLPVESLHFSVGQTPVDLNLITLEALKELVPAFTFPQLALRGGTLLFDRTGQVEAALIRLKERFLQAHPEPLSAHAAAFMRHGHRHLLEKVRGRLESEPLLANFLLGVNPYWLLENYFRLRQLPFYGEKRALAYWRQHEPEIYGTLGAFYKTADLTEKVRLTEHLTELVLAPIGGAWQPGEVLAFGHGESENDKLAEKGVEVYRELFGEASV